MCTGWLWCGRLGVFRLLRYVLVSFDHVASPVSLQVGLREIKYSGGEEWLHKLLIEYNVLQDAIV